MYLRFFIKRFGQMIIVLFLVSIIAFALIRIAPGNPALMLVEDGASEESIRKMEEYLGLDKPLAEQYFIYMSNLLRGDFGTSITYKMPCIDLITARMGATLTLAIFTVMVTILIAFPMGILAGIKQGTATDVFAVLFAMVGQSMSNIWLAMLLIYVFATKLNILPAYGFGQLKNIILPAITMGYPTAAQVTRMLRSGIIDTLREDHVTATRAKGIPEREINFKYVLRNALIPVVLMLGLQFGHLIGGALVVEQVFSWPGLGALTVQAINTRDYPLIQSILIIVSFLFVFMTIVVDFINKLVDPRMTLN